MINFNDLVLKIKTEGYSEEMAEAKLCQDIILLMVSQSRLNKSITFKGGVVMRTISNNARRVTLDLDLDFIKFPLSDNGINDFINIINGTMGINIELLGKPEQLKHQDYNGKRIYVRIKDSFENCMVTKIDIGVHKYLEIEQLEYCFNLFSDELGVCLFINSKEQIFTEKLKSILRFGSLSTRFKDVYDIYYLSKHVDENALLRCFKVLIFKDAKMKENNLEEIVSRVEQTFSNNHYLHNLQTSNKNWVEEKNDTVLNGIVSFLKSLNIDN